MSDTKALIKAEVTLSRRFDESVLGWGAEK